MQICFMEYGWFLGHWSWYFRHVKLENYSMWHFTLHDTSFESFQCWILLWMLWGTSIVVVFVCRWDNWMQQSMLGYQILCAACGNRWVSLFYSSTVPFLPFLQSLYTQTYCFSVDFYGYRLLAIWKSLDIHDNVPCNKETRISYDFDILGSKCTFYDCML